MLDLQLNGQPDAIETAIEIKKSASIPFIYIMVDNDQSIFNRARNTKPAAFISKPFKKLDLQIAIELAILPLGYRDLMENTKGKREKGF